MTRTEIIEWLLSRALFASAVLLSSCSRPSAEDVQQGGKVASQNDVAESRATSDEKRAVKSEIVAASLHVEPNEVRAGDACRLTLAVQIAPGWHIYAADKPTGIAVATKVRLHLPAGLEQTDVWKADEQALPDAESQGLAFVHANRVRFRCIAKADGITQPQCAKVRAVLEYQACNKFMCRMPEKLELETEINLLSK